MANPNNFSELLDPHHPDPTLEGYSRAATALDETPTVAGMDPSTFQKLGRRERIRLTDKEYDAMDALANAVDQASNEQGLVHIPPFTIKEINPENRDNRYAEMKMLASEADHSLVFGGNEISVVNRQTHDTGNETDADYIFLAGSASSGELMGATEWGHLSNQDLVRRNILFAKPQETLDPRTNFLNGMIALPVIQGKPEVTERLINAVIKTNAMVGEIGHHPAVQAALEEYKDIKIGRTFDAQIPQMRGDVPEAEMEKYALVRSITEGVMSTAQSLAAIMADSPIEADIKVVGQKAVQGRWMEHIARGIPLGVTGPLAVAGLVAEGGLLEGTAEEPRLSAEFLDDLMQNVRYRTKEVDLKLAALKTMAMGETVLESLTEGQRDAIQELADMAGRKHIFEQIDHLMATGCPAGTHGKAKNEGLITVTTRMLVENL